MRGVYPDEDGVLDPVGRGEGDDERQIGVHQHNEPNDLTARRLHPGVGALPSRLGILGKRSVCWTGLVRVAKVLPEVILVN